MGIYFGLGSHDEYFFNNTINNSINNQDGWNFAIYGYPALGGSSNLTILNNTIDNYGCAGIVLLKNNNSLINIYLIKYILNNYLSINIYIERWLTLDQWNYQHACNFVSAK
jgi:hypothetical protein